METPSSVVARIKTLFAHYELNANSATTKLGYTSNSKLYKILQGSEPSFPTLVDMLRVFPEVSSDWLVLGVGGMLRATATDAPLPSQGLAAASSWAVTSGKVLAVTVDQAGNDNTVLVPVRAQAGYTRQHSEAVYLQQLRPYHIPGFEHGTYRAFEVSGDSMEPTINHADIVVCSYVERWDLIKPGAIYVVVTAENVLLKRIPARIVKRTDLVGLLSDNYTVKPYELPAADILELWMVQGYLSTYLPSAPDITIERLWEVIEALGFDRGEVRRHLAENAPALPLR